MYSYHQHHQPPPVAHIKIVYVHGFMGSVKTFKDLPIRLGDLLHKQYPNILVDNNVYLYKTSGKYKDAPRNLYNAMWRFIQTMWRNDSNPLIIFVGHSMGGLVAADTIRMIYNWGWTSFPNGAKVIGLLAYDTPYFSIDREFIKAGLKTVTKEPLSSALHLYLSKRAEEEKSIIRRFGEKIAVKAVKELNYDISHLMNECGEFLVRSFVAAAVLLAAFAYYLYKELDHDPWSNHRETYPDNYIVLADDYYEPTLYAQKIFDYMMFAKENFRSEEKQDDRVTDLRDNGNIKFKCIYNIVPKLQHEYGARPYSQFVRTKEDNRLCKELFQPLQWPADPFGRTRPKHFKGGAESVLAHIQMFGAPQCGPNEPNPTLDRLHDLSVNFLKNVIDSHFDRHGYPYRQDNCYYGYY